MQKCPGIHPSAAVTWRPCHYGLLSPSLLVPTPPPTRSSIMIRETASAGSIYWPNWYLDRLRHARFADSPLPNFREDTDHETPSSANCSRTFDYSGDRGLGRIATRVGGNVIS
ncbi:hypothetical protein J6590_081030 [Homalodisca vitripennis]|nr:hypothetical protein J6590_081030 [Homalodisca vitripennis]